MRWAIITRYVVNMVVRIAVIPDVYAHASSRKRINLRMRLTCAQYGDSLHETTAYLKKMPYDAVSLLSPGLDTFGSISMIMGRPVYSKISHIAFELGARHTTWYGRGDLPLWTSSLRLRRPGFGIPIGNRITASGR